MKYALVIMAAVALTECQQSGPVGDINKTLPGNANYANENTDHGVPPQSTPFFGGLGQDTPISIPGGQRVNTLQMQDIVRKKSARIFDVWDSSPRTFPDSVAAAYLGQTAQGDEGEKALRDRFLSENAEMKNKPVVFLCAGPKCRESYNAALRAAQAGFTQVKWYRGGYAAWRAAGL